MSETPIKTLGKYQIRGELGKGAMGVVYLGYDPALEREVAIKVMGGATVSDPELKKRFEIEAKASAKLQHPNIVTVFDFGHDEKGAPYMAMELLRGQDLEQRIRRNPLTFREKLEVLAQICRGLAHAHKNLIVHRDIKPANIFIASGGGEAKIMDFGVARLQQSSQTQTGAVLGTADYMSPEQIRGAKVDGRSDIFSAGVILYRLLTNKKPFAGENIQAVFFKVLNQEPPDIVLPDGNEMPELQAIVDKALSKVADERYAMADDFADDLNDLIQLYHEVLNENTVFDTVFDPAATPDMDSGTGSDGTGRRRTTTTGRVLGATSSGSRARRPGTSSYPSTAPRTGQMTGAGRTATGRTSVSAPTRMMRGTQVGTMSAPRANVGIPMQESSGWGKYIAVIALLIAMGGGVFWFTRKSTGNGGTAGASAPPTPTIDVAAQLALAQRSLDAGQLSPALQAVDAILFAEPSNPEALALKQRVNQAIDEIEAAPAPNTASGQQVEPIPAPNVDRGPSNSQKATALAADASLAIGAGDLVSAERLIRQGRQLDPTSPRWHQLDVQLERSRDQSQHAAIAAEQQARIDAFVTEATTHLKAQNYEGAIAAYDQALAIDPNNAQLITAKNTAKNAMQQVAAAAAATVASLVIQESKTRFVPPGESDETQGFEAGGGVRVKRATAAPENPAELIVQIHPTTVQTGDPYYLRVRIHNQGNRPIGIKFVELISTFGSRTTGKGQQLPPRVQRINPRETSLIYEVSGTWNEDQNAGSIQAIVTLIGDAKLLKTIQWQ